MEYHWPARGTILISTKLDIWRPRSSRTTAFVWSTAAVIGFLRPSTNTCLNPLLWLHVRVPAVLLCRNCLRVPSWTHRHCHRASQLINNRASICLQLRGLCSSALSPCLSTHQQSCFDLSPTSVDFVLVLAVCCYISVSNFQLRVLLKNCVLFYLSVNVQRSVVFIARVLQSSGWVETSASKHLMSDNTII